MKHFGFMFYVQESVLKNVMLKKKIQKMEGRFQRQCIGTMMVETADKAKDLLWHIA